MTQAAIVIDMTKPGAQEFVHLAALKGACRLEGIGLKRRGRSALSIAREEFGLSKRAPATECIAKIEARMAEILAEKGGN